MVRYPNNPLAVDALPDIVRTGFSRAALLNLDVPEQRWDFLLNPQALPYRATVNYAVGNLIGVNQQPIIWTSTDGLTLELTDLILDTTAERKSVRAAIDRLVALGKGAPTLGRPPLLSFVCGETTFSECVLIGDIAWTELASINGVAVRAKLSFSLRKAGTVAPLITLPSIEPIPSTTNSGGIPIPAPTPTPTPGTEPGTTPTPPSSGSPADESAIDAIGFGACISLGGASAFAIGKRKILTARHMVTEGGVGSTYDMKLLGGTAASPTTIKSFKATLKAIDESLDAAWLETSEDMFDIYWELGNENNLKDGDRCLAYGFPSGGLGSGEEKNMGVFKGLKSGSEKVQFGMPDPNNRLLYPGNSGGSICCAQPGSSEYGKIISLTSGGDGRPSKPSKDGETVRLQGSQWQTDRVYGPGITEVKAAFNL